MEKTILYGNGVNLLGGGPSWNKLLQDISKKSLLPPIQSNTLKYEYIILPQKETTNFPLVTSSGHRLVTSDGKRLVFGVNTELKMKTALAQKLKEFTPSYFYDKLVELDADNYITTNYELFLPQKFSLEIKKFENPLVYRCRSLITDNCHKTFWNIHGDTENPENIILGLSDYCEYVARINEYLKQSKPGILGSWINLFFNSDVHILGLAMANEEIDLWNVLTTRKRKRRHNSKECQNEIYYYAIQDESFDPGKKELLKALDVNVVDIEFDWGDNAYKNAYDRIYELIKNA